MQKLKVQDPNTLAFNASQPAPYKVGNLGYWLTGFLLDVYLSKTDGASPVAYQDWLMRSIQGISLVGKGRQYVAVPNPDTRSVYWWMRQRMGGGYRLPNFETGAQSFHAQIPILFSPNPVLADGSPNYWDENVGIEPSEDLNLTINWAAASALGSNITIGSGLARLTWLGILPPAGQEPKWYPEYTATAYQPTQQYAGLAGTQNVPTGYYYRRTSLVFLNGASPNDVRTDGQSGNAISEFGLKSVTSTPHFDLKVWDFARDSQGVNFQVADDNSGVPGATAAYAAAVVSGHHNPGVGMVDWGRFVDSHDRKVGNSSYVGLNLYQTPDGQAKSENTARLAFTVDNNSNTQALVCHERYKPYS